MDNPKMSQKQAVLAGGCFWGMEELFRSQPGVIETEVGYAGGDNQNPTYEYHPGHAEAIKITYDDAQTDFSRLLDYFFRIHDPTTKNRQGNDVGSSYRSAIFYSEDTQRKTAQEYVRLAENSGLYKGPITTTIEPLDQFWSAEQYHQDYLQKNPGGYTCHFERTSKPFSY